MTNNFGDAFRDYNKGVSRKKQEYSGLLGIYIKGKRRVSVPNRPNYVYVRLRDSQSEVIQAYNETVSVLYDLPVIMIRDGARYKITGKDTGRYGSYWSFEESYYLPAHGASHSLSLQLGGGSDPTFVFGRQFVPLGAFPSGTDAGGGVVLSDDYVYKKSDNSWLVFGITGTPDFLTYKPTGSTCVMLLLYADTDTGNLSFIVNSGSHFDNTLTGTYDVAPYIPTITDNAHLPMFGIRLASGTDVIDYANLYDVRQYYTPLSTGGAGNGSGFDGYGVAVQEDGGFIASGTVLNFVGNNVDVSASGTNVRVFITGSTGATSCGTYQITAIPSPETTITGTVWKVPDAVYASGSLAVFNNGLIQYKGTDYEEFVFVSGTYRYLSTPSTGTNHMVIYGIPCAEQSFVTGSDGGATGTYYRIPIIISGSSDGALTDYQVKVNLPYTSNMQSDFNDVRFRDTDAVSLLDFWSEYYFEKENGIFWINVPSIPSGTASTTIYAYYGVTGSPGGPDDSATFLVGADFDDDSTTGLTINTAGSATATTASPSTLLGFNLGRAGKYSGNPNLPLGAGGAWDDTQIRDVCVVINVSGTNVVEPDGLWAYYGGYDGVSWSIGLAKSTDNEFTWNKYGSNPIISGAGSGWYQNGIFQPSVTKLSDTQYVMAAIGFNSSTTGSMGILSSTDGLSWSDGGQKLQTSDFSDGATGLAEMGVPRMLRCSDGVWRMMLEGRTSGEASGWRLYGATASSPTGAWTPVANGQPIFEPGAGWESVGVANASFIETGDGNYLMAYNGISGSWQIGFASAPTLTGTWTRNADNPILSKDPLNTTWDDYGVEASFLTKDINSSHIRLLYQGYADGTSVRCGLALIPQGKVLNPKDTAATTDGWVVGMDMDAYTTFIFEILINNTDDVNNAGNIQFGLYDSASVPSPTDNTTWNATMRFGVARTTPSDANSNQFYIFYIDTGGTYHFWTGSTWTTSAPTFFHRQGEVRIKIFDDGTNYQADLQDRGRTTLLSNVASIAKSSVKTFSNGRTLVMAEPFTNFYYSGQDFDYLYLRKFTSNEPDITVGTEEAG